MRAKKEIFCHAQCELEGLGKIDITEKDTFCSNEIIKKYNEESLKSGCIQKIILKDLKLNH